jgi:ketosteroid isomerase-like protein
LETAPRHVEMAMSKTMTLERATEFGNAWNSGDADLVASFFADDGVYHASVGPDRLGMSYFGKEEIRKGVKAFFERFPDGRFENLKVVVAGDLGSFEWDFVATDASGKSVTTAGCDLLTFRGDKVISKNAFSQGQGLIGSLLICPQANLRKTDFLKTDILFGRGYLGSRIILVSSTRSGKANQRRLTELQAQRDEPDPEQEMASSKFV